MKKLLLFILLTVLSIGAATAQVSLPNGGFENWTSSVTYNPDNYMVTSNQQAILQAGAAPNCLRVADPYHGNYAIQITTVLGTADTTMGYFLDGNPNGPPQNWTGGIPYTEMPTGIQGYYKSAITAGDIAHLFVNFKLGGVSIGFYVFDFTGNNSNYTPFNFTFMPALTQTPDSIIFGAASSDFLTNTQIPGSMLQLDSISFTGAATQPALLNGDFENWTADTLKSLDNWYAIGGGGNSLGSVTQTTDAYSGNYALELTTYAGDNNGNPRAQPGTEGTGYYVCPNGPGMCNLVGGYPYINMVDTLAFYYKYAPANPTDTAQVSMVFKFNGTQTWWTGGWMLPSANYQYFEVPINLFSPADSVIVMFQSSQWQDSTLVSVGDVLIVDDAYFKSQPLTTSINQWKWNSGELVIAPNPSSDLFYISNYKSSIVSCKVMDVVGNVVLQSTINSNQSTIDIRSFAKGIYFVEVLTSDAQLVRKKMVKE